MKTFKSIIAVILLALTLTSCSQEFMQARAANAEVYQRFEKTGYWLDAKPDEESRSISNGYEIRTHTYHCYGGKYVVITSMRAVNSTHWSRDYYTSDGLCKK